MKSKLIIALIVAGVIAILVGIGWQQHRIKKLNTESQLQKIQLSMFEDSVSVLRDQNNNLTYKIASVEVTVNNAKSALEQAGFEIKDIKAREVKWRKVNIALEAELEAKGEGTITMHDTITIAGDTIKRSSFNYYNRHISFSGMVDNGNVDFKYVYRTKISLLSERKGKTTVVSAYLTDPNAAITTAHSITITPVKHWYTNKWLYLGAGIITGFLIAK